MGPLSPPPRVRQGRIERSQELLSPSTLQPLNFKDGCQLGKSCALPHGGGPSFRKVRQQDYPMASPLMSTLAPKADTAGFKVSRWAPNVRGQWIQEPNQPNRLVRDRERSACACRFRLPHWWRHVRGY